MRGQANLPALAVALIAVTAATGIGLVVADGAFASADRQPGDRRAAVALAERLVAPDGPLTIRQNVLNRSRVDGLTPGRLDESYPVADDRPVRLVLADETILERDSPTGPTVERLVIVGTRQVITRRPPLGGRAISLPRRTERVDLSIQPPNETTVRTVRANDRIVLRNPDGLEGNFTVRTARYETVRLAFEATGPLPRGSVAVTYYPVETTKARLEVTLDG